MALMPLSAPVDAPQRSGTGEIVPGEHDNSSSTLQIWDAAQPDDYSRWVRQWSAWPEREVFAHPAYLNLFKTESDRVLCAFHKTGSGCVLYPFLLRDLTCQPYWESADGPACDLTAPFSYGGPFAFGVRDREALAASFWPAFDRWAATAGLVSEFVRLTLFTDSLIDDPSHREFRQKNVVRTLDLEEPELWMDCRHKVRKNVNRARNVGVRVEVDTGGERLDDFLRVYSGTMDRRQAGGGFYFDRSFFERLLDGLAGQWALFHAVLDGRVISSELVLISARNIYSFLGGTDRECFEMRPNDLLKWEIMLWAKRANKQRFVLGGGASPEDGIFNYKLSFAPSGAVDFYLRKRIVWEDRYRLYCDRSAALRRDRNDPPATDFFPAYRA